MMKVKSCLLYPNFIKFDILSPPDHQVFIHNKKKFLLWPKG